MVVGNWELGFGIGGWEMGLGLGLTQRRRDAEDFGPRMLRLPAPLLVALRPIGSAVGFGGRLIADWKWNSLGSFSSLRLAAPRNPNWSR